uniref:Uncharacterized protein n=1 Tax=Timema genevievae TaxID=629358 RepID=A0A7R9K0A4_TIMGE|nr:unnamed protein product [Timema genevievae]
MSSSSSSISSSPSSLLDSCCSLIISALSRVPQTVMSSSAGMYSSYVQPGANLCHVSSSHGRFKVRGADEDAVDGPGCGSLEGPGWELASTSGGSCGSLALAAANREKCQLRDAMPPRNLRLCNLLLIHLLDDLVFLHERQEAPHQLETSPERNRDDSFGKCRTFSATSSPHQYHKRFVSSTPILQLWHNLRQGVNIVHLNLMGFNLVTTVNSQFSEVELVAIMRSLTNWRKEFKPPFRQLMCLERKDVEEFFTLSKDNTTGYAENICLRVSAHN